MRKSKHRTWKCRCGITYSVLATDSMLHLLPDRIKCFAARGCRYYMVRDDKLPPGPLVAAAVIYATMCGMGTETERQCGPEVVKKMLLGQMVKEVTIGPALDKNRSLISSITLGNGKTLHLAPSTRGVTIYKVTG